MGPKKKEKLTKAQKLALQQEEEERIRKEEELARRLAEEEERKRLEEERKRQEELERIRLEEAEIREKQQTELLTLFQSLELIFQTNKQISWEEWLWHCYVHEWKIINPLSLPMVNAFLSEWEEDDNCKLKPFFTNCHFCFNLIQEVEMALINCPELDLKTECLWKEISENLKMTVNKKLDVITFLLLRDGTLYLSPDSYNMEYGVTDKDFIETQKDSYPKVTVCLWANFVKNIRYRGMDLPELGFRFELPESLVREPCAVRFVHSLVDTISFYLDDTETKESQTQLEEESAEESKGDAEEIQRLKESLMEEPTDQTHADEKEGEETLDVEPTTESEMKSTSETSLNVESSPSTETFPHSDTSAGAEEHSSSMLSSTTVATDSTHEIKDVEEPGPVTVAEKEEIFISSAEYILVGGIIHFELLKIPLQPAEIGSWILIQCEEKVPQKIPYKTTITPIRQPPPNMSLAAAAEFSDSEIKRYEREMSTAVSVSLRLPKGVLFLEQPVPAFWMPDRNSFLRSGFFDVSLDEDGLLSFKVNQFGKIGLFQRKHANLPLKFWEITTGSSENSVSLIIKGAVLMMEITINNKGCCVCSLQYKQKSILQELYNEVTTPEELAKKLLAVGICIEYSKGVVTHPKAVHKLDDMELWTHLCMSVLCSSYAFSWSKWNGQVSSDKIVLNCASGSEKKERRLILVTPERAVFLKCSESDKTFTEEPEDNQQFCSDLYHLLVNQENNGVPDADLTMNIYLLLKACKLFSCS